MMRAAKERDVVRLPVSIASDRSKAGEEGGE